MASVFVYSSMCIWMLCTCSLSKSELLLRCKFPWDRQVLALDYWHLSGHDISIPFTVTVTHVGLTKTIRQKNIKFVLSCAGKCIRKKIISLWKEQLTILTFKLMWTISTTVNKLINSCLLWFYWAVPCRTQRCCRLPQHTPNNIGCCCNLYYFLSLWQRGTKPWSSSQDYGD